MSTIDLIDVSVLRAACPEKSAAQLAPWVDPIKKACSRFEIDRIRRIAAFIGTMAHEGGFTPGREENLNYSAKRMAEVWPGRFASNGRPNALATALDRKPVEFANHVYANRLGNGGPETGDGWRFRGVCQIQLTGRANHEAFAKEMGMSLDQAEAFLRTLEGDVAGCAWFWEENDINRLADTPGIVDETKAINGGTVGLEDRKARFDRTVERLLQRERGL